MVTGGPAWCLELGQRGLAARWGQVTVPPLPFMEPSNHPILRVEEKPATFLPEVARIDPSGHLSGVSLVSGSTPYSSRTGDGDLVSLLLHPSPFRICQLRFARFPRHSVAPAHPYMVHTPFLRANTMS